jgi:prepilin-type N-terminal cleavage/methylation domain-containing protein
MRRDNGFTLIELLIAIAIFSLMMSVVFVAFSQSVSIWERADRYADKSDALVFLNHWMKNLFHSAENQILRYHNKRMPIFLGDKDKVFFISSDPLMEASHIISFVKVEFKGGSIVYSEADLFRTEQQFQNSGQPAFPQEYEVFSGMEDARFSFLTLEDGKETWTSAFDSGKMLTIPRAVKIEFSYNGSHIEIRANIISDQKGRDPFPEILI